MAAATKLCDKSHLDLTSREIAEAAGTHAGMVNYYFQGKDGLLLELIKKAAKDIDQHLDAIEAYIESNDDDPTEYIVRELIVAYWSKVAMTPIFYIEMFRTNTPVSRYYAQNREFNSVRIEKMIRRIVAKGIYRAGIDTVAATWMLLSLVVGPVMPMCSAIGTVPMESWIENVTRMLRRELLPDAEQQ